MEHEVKVIPLSTKEINDRTVVGIAAVHGNVDDGGDRSWPGSFSDITVNGRVRARFLWMHNANEPPIAAINYVREVPRLELPAKVLEYAPEATGGVEISRTYLDTPRGNEILIGIKAGAIEEMSYAYDVTQSDYEETEGRQIRNLRKLQVFDFSDVTWGMNPATVAAKGKPIDVHQAQVLATGADLIGRYKDLYSLRAKEGRALSDANRKRIKEMHDGLISLAADLADLLAMTEPQKAALVAELEKADPAEARKALALFLRLQAHYNGAIA
jgi:hypothetical protein